MHMTKSIFTAQKNRLFTTFNTNYGTFLGGFRAPILRRYRTINGVAVSVMAILTGAKTLWTA